MAGEVQISGPDLALEGIAVEELTVGTPKPGSYDDRPVLVVTTEDGTSVVGGRCTHYGGPLAEGLCVGDEVRCPWHHAAFDVQTGEAIGAPALNPIPVYDTSVREGRLFVTGVREAAVPPRTAPAAPQSVVIVGAGAAGAAAAEALRRYGYDGPITLVGQEPPVDRPNLSKDYLAGTAPEEWIPLRSEKFYADAGIDLLAGEAVTSIDRAAKVVHLQSERELVYGALLLATGAEPRRLPVPGAGLPHVHYLRTLADSRAIIDALQSARRAAVVGAGFIGLEVAASLRERAVDVTVVAPEPVPLVDAVGETLGRLVADLHSSHGVAFRLGSQVEEIRPGDVLLDDGGTIGADLVVVGIGVVPRTGIAEAAGLTVENGILADDRLRTDDPNIWTAGDVARFPGPDGPVRVEHWVVAERQGQAAARNMLGYDVPFAEPPFFWSQHYDVRINVTGHVAGFDEEVVDGDPDDHDVLVAYRKNGTVTAVATVHRDRDNLRAEHALAVGDQETLHALAGAAR